MATTPTNKPIPSEDPRDLKFNAGKIDEVVNSDAHYYTDRFGVRRWTTAGFQYTAEEAIRNYGYITMDSFEDGATLTLPNQALRHEANGEYYRWDGEFPKVVPAGSTPDSTGEVKLGAWVSVGDASLRSQLASKLGYSLIGELDSVSGFYGLYGENNSRVKLKSWSSDYILVTGGKPTGGGEFIFRDNMPKSAHNGGTIISPTVPYSDASAFLLGAGETDASGSGCWVRDFDGAINALWFGAVGDGITDDTRSIQGAINAANPFGKKIYVPAGRYKCKPLIAKQGFKLFGAGNRYSASTIDTNISLFLCDLADGEAFISYVGDGKWPEGEVEIDNLAFENLNSLGGTAGVVAANNRVFWAVADSADVYPARWIQKKEGGANCPKSVFTRCTFSKFFIGIDIHSWMSRFEDLTSYSCGVLLRAYGTSNIVNRVWAVDPLWAGIQMKSTYSEVNACSFGEQPTNNAAAKGFELHGGYVVINGCGAEATIEDFIWAYNGSLIVNNSRPSTALPTKNFITIDAYANAMINNSYTPGSFSNSFSRAKDIFALDGITISPAPRCTDTNKLPFTESAFNASSGYYEGLCGTASKEASAIVLKTNNQNTNPKWSGESTLRSLPLLWEYSGTVRGSSVLKSDVNFSVNGSFLNTDGGYQFDCRISKISNKGVILSSKLQDSGVLVSVYKKAGIWTHDYVYYGAAAGLTNDKGEQLIKAVFFQGDPLSTIRITIRDEVMTGKTEDELTNSQVELIINASGDVPLLTGQNEAFTYSMRTTP